MALGLFIGRVFSFRIVGALFVARLDFVGPNDQLEDYFGRRCRPGR
jgi:hypothetical protein